VNEDRPGPGSSPRRCDGAQPWRATVITLFPELFPGPLGASLVGKALERGDWNLDTVQLRNYGIGPHHAVDDRPFGGGAGMVMRPDVLAAAIDDVIARDAAMATPSASTADDGTPVSPPAGAPRASPSPPGGATQTARPLIYLSPRGLPLRQSRVRELSSGPGVILLAGRFEGVDQRVLDARGIEEISIGDYVLSGGEIAACVLIDACVRLRPGVLGAAESLDSESFENGLLEYPHYTRPRSFEGLEVPEVLVSGDHEKIADWRREQALELTGTRRPDLLAGRNRT
jgi:tRNA (guanine37-N1)-methyltransferase